MSSYDVSELNRQVANLVRIGSVSELDEANARVKLSVSGLTTDWLPWSAARAGKTRTWSPPQIGEQVIMVSPFGDMGQAVVVGSLFSDAATAPAASKDQETTVYPDGSTVDYNSATNTLTVTVAGTGNVVVNCKVATVNAETSVTLDTPETTCTGNLTVLKSLTMGAGGGSVKMTGPVEITGATLTHNGKNVGSTHQHTDVQPGGSNTGAPA